MKVRDDNKGTALKPLLACAGYLLVGPALIFLNRYIMKELKFAYPMSLSGLGLVFSSVISFILVKVWGVCELKYANVVDTKFYLTRIVPVGLGGVLTLNFGNRVYLHLSVSLIQMLKAFTPVMTLAMMYLAGLSRPSCAMVISILLLSGGTAVASAGGISFDFLGLFYMFLAEFFEALRLVMLQILLASQGLKFSVVEGLFWIAPASVLVMVTTLLPFFEFPTMIKDGAFNIMAENPGTFFAAGMLGFGVNFMGYFVVQTSSALVLKSLGIVRNIGIVVASVMLLSETVTAQEAFGYLVSLSGFSLFNYLKLKGLAERPTTDERKGYAKVASAPQHSKDAHDESATSQP